MPKQMVKQLVAAERGVIEFPHQPPLQVNKGDYYPAKALFRPTAPEPVEVAPAWDSEAMASRPITNEREQASALILRAHYDWKLEILAGVANGAGGVMVLSQPGDPFLMDESADALGQALIARLQADYAHRRALVVAQLAAYAERQAKAQAKAEEQALSRKAG